MVDQKTLKITEVFYSLQGETNTVGLPTVFVRLTGCPLRCGYCDTAYAFSGGQTMSLSEIIARVTNFQSRCVTVTGGEPLAQPAVMDLMRELCDLGYHVSLETSGALDVQGVDRRVHKVVDVKTPSSGESHRHLNTNMAHLLPHDQVKYVIGDRADYQWAKDHMSTWDVAARCEVLFSPAQGQLVPADLADWVLLDQLQVRFQLQLHKVLWGDVPGK